MQAETQIPTTPPLSGANAVDRINAALQTITTDFSGSDDPAALAWPFARWADTANGRWKIRNAAGTAWIDLGPLLQEGEDPADGALFASQAWVAKQVATALDPAVLGWLSQPIGVPLPLWDHITGVTLPPTDDPRFRYIVLTADDDYNDGVLTDESVTGSAPLVQATAVIDLEDSPLHGQTIHLINTERRFLRAGGSGVVEADALQNITGAMSTLVLAGSSGTSSGAFSLTGSASGFFTSGASGNARGVQFDSANVARTDTETRPKNVGATYYMRVL